MFSINVFEYRMWGHGNFLSFRKAIKTLLAWKEKLGKNPESRILELQKWGYEGRKNLKLRFLDKRGLMHYFQSGSLEGHHLNAPHQHRSGDGVAMMGWGVGHRNNLIIVFHGFSEVT